MSQLKFSTEDAVKVRLKLVKVYASIITNTLYLLLEDLRIENKSIVTIYQLLLKLFYYILLNNIE